MPHAPRKKGESGFYHVVAKGDGNQVIFEGDRDRRRYVGAMEEALENHNVKLHAYCLMSNHVHLLAQDCGTDADTGCDGAALSDFMKRLNEQYAMYYRRITGRVGRVFQRPFWSEPIETDEYFLAAMRYIHANPEPAGICRARDYPWSSYNAYLKGGSFVETALGLELLGGAAQFEKFSESGGTWATPFSKSRLSKHLKPDELVNVALALLGRDVLNSLRSMQAKERTPYINKLATAGFTESEIMRVTGLGRSIVRKALL